MSDRKPYTYIIGWSELKKFYAGVRYAKGCSPEDFLVKYFTSSKTVKQYIKDHGLPDIVHIDKVFDSADMAIKREKYMLEYFDVLHNSNWLNENISGAISINKSSEGGVKSNKLMPTEIRRKGGLSSSKLLTKEQRSKGAHTVNKTKLVCPHCNFTLSMNVAKRWHFDNCKHKNQLMINI